LHTQYDIRTSIPVFMHVSPASVHDIKMMDKISYEPGSFYIFDRGYLDFERLYTIHHSKSFFVIRARKDLKFKRVYSFVIDKTTGVRCDQIGQLKWFYSIKGYPEKIRRIKFYDKEHKRTFVFLTNHMELPAEEIASLYKNRWKVELFFKWIKQHLRITAFWGRTENAVKTQVYTAVITYTIVSMIREKLSSGYTTYEVLQILGTSLLDKTPINQLLQKKNIQDVKELNYNQLKIF
jgi:IS4 transposase